MKLAVDPAVCLALRASLALLFLSAAAHKLRDPAAFRLILRRYELLPAAWTAAAATALALLEAAIGASLVFTRIAAVAAAALLAVYGGAIAVNLLRGRRDIDCGCSGPARRVPLRWSLAWRNLVLLALALVSALPPSGRSLEWIDGVSILAAVLFLAMFHAAVETALANAGRLAPLRAVQERA